MTVYASFTVMPLPLPVTDDEYSGEGRPLMLTNVHVAEPGSRWKLILPADVMVAVAGSNANVLGEVNVTFTVWSGMVYSRTEVNREVVPLVDTTSSRDAIELFLLAFLPFANESRECRSPISTAGQFLDHRLGIGVLTEIDQGHSPDGEQLRLRVRASNGIRESERVRPRLPRAAQVTRSRERSAECDGSIGRRAVRFDVGRPCLQYVLARGTRALRRVERVVNAAE